MRAIVIGGGMGGLFSAIALRQAGAFDSIDVYEQSSRPTTAGAGLNIAPNGARLCHWLGIDLDGGDPKGPDGAIDGGRAAIMDSTRNIMPDLSVTKKPFDYNAPEKIEAGGGFHHMHRQDLLMCLHKRALEFAPETGANCPIRVHHGKRLVNVVQDEQTVTATFEDGSTAVGEVLIGADGINSQVLKLVWPDTPPRRFTGSLIYRGVIRRETVATLRKRDGSPLDLNPMDGSFHDLYKRNDSLCMNYWLRGGELLNVAITWYEPESTEFTEDWGDWRAISNADVVATIEKTWAGDPRMEDLIAFASAIERPTKWGLYDRDAFEQWQDGRICLLGDAAHPMLPSMGQGASQSFEDGAALSASFKLHGSDVYSALLHYERVRHFRATRFQFGSKMAFKHLEPEDSAERQQILKATNERDSAIFDHEKRVGDDDSWIYEFDARQIGDRLPLRKLGPWDFRSREQTATVRRDLIKNLWMPAHPHTGERKVTREELEAHGSFEDCWIVIGGKVYDLTEWKDRHPGGPFVARLYAGKDATAAFSDFHSNAAKKHMEHFCIGDYIG